MTDERDIHREIIEGLQETINFVKGNPIDGHVTYMFNGQEIDPREIREDLLGKTRQQFSEMFSIDKANLRNWETGRRSPNKHTLAYYLLIKKNHQAVYEMLHGHAMS